MIKVLINGAKGKMGQAAIAAVEANRQLILVGKTDKEDHLDQCIAKFNPDVVVDLTHPDAVYQNITTILNKKCHAVVGTTGLTQDQLDTCGQLAKQQEVALIVCPNFAISAILMMKFAQQAAEFMKKCDIIEYHHDRKADTPSGTAIKTAELISQACPDVNSPSLSEHHVIDGSRGAIKNNIPIHAIRLPGVVANQEVIFGAQGQTLTLRHDTISREAFMPGLMLAIKATAEHKGLVYGLENLLFNSN